MTWCFVLFVTVVARGLNLTTQTSVVVTNANRVAHVDPFGVAVACATVVLASTNTTKLVGDTPTVRIATDLDEAHRDIDSIQTGSR